MCRPLPFPEAAMRSLLPPAHRHRRPRSPLSRVAFLAAFLVATSACARHGRARSADEDAPEPVPEFVLVSVENHNTSDVIVWLVQPDGLTTRIGSVAGSSNAVLQFRGRYIEGGASLQLIARPIGGVTAVRSERFTVHPGQQVTWTLETSLQRSSLSVY